jgi:hypothetical protein
MSEENYTHWKAMFDNKFMGPYSLTSNCKSITLTIDSVVKGKEKGTDGSNIEGIVIYFKEKDPWVKPLWCGKYQCDLIAKALRPKLKGYANYAQKWIGFRVELAIFEETWFGKTDEYLRIHKLARDIPKKELVPDTDSWEGAVNAIIEKQCTIEDIKSKRSITEENLIKLQEAVKGGEDA